MFATIVREVEQRGTDFYHVWSAVKKDGFGRDCYAAANMPTLATLTAALDEMGYKYHFPESERQA